mmetsp:Transcript_83/g.294  ORF Transcript_83/g.294 Transcript_83/m.294 type:complete len:409 (+) Transcript_83:95-1321(+)|eukprot:CAMPEP_0114607990 /NCGR_PEP_ID=MMETSP0168-20121206/2349_1 /TAXON_ID=95228 ORGANISM="Vannella sp., Strain DIVA3 517/6/12" /NCGR_SAMPLE_ID=MMETSP0168 /ASSEMBLY_ACC=CAM_ASM_000044 /LENGTH=408 /DNA_ID=CAMNT_0001818877 /DNA_START=35 /DNA_END=1261 /DNA_ORIENTATION=+
MTYIAWCLLGAAATVIVVLVRNTLYIRRKLLHYHSDKTPEHATVTSLRELHHSYPQIEKDAFKEQLSSVVREVREDSRPERLKGDPARRGLYAHGDLMWEVGRESINFAGAARAVFLQTAHPYVASGVQQHSKVADDVHRRFYNTFHHVFNINFGELKDAERSAKQVRAIHDRVFGELEPTSGDFPYEERHLYTANHEGAVIWVWATLVETSMLMFELFRTEMPLHEKEIYYEQQKEMARFFGVEKSSVPPDWQSFMQYTTNMWNGDAVTVSDTAREMEKTLFRPTAFVSKLVTDSSRRLTFAIMPERLARQYGYEITWADRWHVYISFGIIRTIYQCLPGGLRYLTAYVKAVKRTTGEDVCNPFLANIAAHMGSFIMDTLLMNPSMNVKNWNDSKIKHIDTTALLAE